MTREEHLLMLTMFAKQQQLIQALASILKSRDLAGDDDLRAFEFAAIQDEPSTLAVLRSVKSFYLNAAQDLKIETGIKAS